ncbi:hypothetical protein [Nocardia sp. MH4]|uniref:hypothetical protein n=2 Tax=unclassified Nocardia TaxID=2637762 RepID=UPI001C4F1C48|nr:hypothetical protein [Nocardia sp. MH4]
MTEHPGAFPAMPPVTSAEIVIRRSPLRWFWSVSALVACGALLWGCANVLVISQLDTDLSAAESQRLMERRRIQIPDSFEFVGMRRFGCPPLAGMCGYVGSYVAPAEQLPDYRSMYTDPTHRQPLRPVTCAELKKQLGFDPATRTGDNDWKFDCTNAIDLFASLPYGDEVHGYPTLTIARDAQFATIYYYTRPS